MINLTEEQSFLLFFVLGVIIGLIFDTFKSKRKVFKTNELILFIEDLMFLLISSFLFIYSLIVYNNGILRFYIILGTLLGIAIYSLTLSRGYVIILTRFVEICRNISNTFTLCFKSVTNALFRLFHKDF